MLQQNEALPLWKIAFYYIKDNRKGIISICTIIGIYLVIFHLYWLPMEPAYYGALLSFFILFLLMGYDFWSYYKRYTALQQMQKRILVGLLELPEPRCLEEASYQWLLQILDQDKAQRISQADKKRTELYDYYSLWAHQIKTPIAAMRLLLAAQQLDAGKLSLELFKIERYVELVLQYLRMESMSSDLSLKYMDVFPLVKQAVRRYSTFFIQKKIKLNLPTFTLLVVTDEKWLEFVLEQLLSNALKYTEEGGEISIWVEEEEKKLILKDTGVGIQKEDLPRIFERGFTGYNGRMDKKSTGIGLYLVKTILSRLVHSIQIESELHRGTMVTLFLSRDAIEQD